MIDDMSLANDTLMAPEGNPNLVYHYTSAENLRLILESGKFRLGSFVRMNDPRESKSWTLTAPVPTGDVSLDSLTVQSDVEREVNRLLRQNTRLACFTRDGTPAADSQFWRGWGRASMWDRYADKHRGICLAFDMADFGLAVERAVEGHSVIRTQGAVVYEDRPFELPFTDPIASVEDVKDAIDEATSQKGVVSKIFMQKSLDWSSEREWRSVVVPWESASELTVEVPLDSLRAVVAGDGYGDRAYLGDVIANRYGHLAENLTSCNWFRGAPVLRPLNESI